MLKKIAVIFLGTILFCLALYELFSFFEKRSQLSAGPQPTIQYEFIGGRPNDKFPDFAQFGYLPETLMHDLKLFEDKTIYDVYYQFNSYGLRGLLFKHPLEAKKFLILTGGSYTFGKGLPLEETFPFMLEDGQKNIDVYDISFIGGGLHTSLRYLEYVKIKDFVKHQTGNVVYVFTIDHLSSWFMRPDYLAWAPEHQPHYEVSHGKVLYKGEIGEETSYKEFKLLEKTKLKNTVLKLETLKEGASDEWDDQEIDDFVLGVRELKEKYLQLFPKAKFTFLFHPESGLKLENKKRMIEDLKGFGIDLVDAQDLHSQKLAHEKLDPAAFRIPHDGNPNALMNQEVAHDIETYILK